MTHAEIRSGAQRKADTLARLGESNLDGWVASVGGGGAHLVPLSVVWTGDCLVLAVEESSLTARNITASGVARVGLGPTRDVVLIDAVLDRAVPVAEAGDIAERYVAQADWDPREAGDGYVYLTLRPTRIQAWREVNEMTGRTLMRAGTWVV